MVYDGQDRRRINKYDEEKIVLLTRIGTNLDNFIKRFSDHEEVDCKKFDDIKQQLIWITRILYISIGFITCIEFFSRFIK